jgi:hypothetical protein
LGEEFVRFCGGFWEKWVVGDGFFVVKVWWSAGELWRVDGWFVALKIFHFFEIYFLGVPFWVGKGRSSFS